MNASIKSGTNSSMGAAWSSSATTSSMPRIGSRHGGIPKGELRQNQFGVSGGGPIIKQQALLLRRPMKVCARTGHCGSGNVPTSLDIQRLHQPLRHPDPSAGKARQDVLGAAFLQAPFWIRNNPVCRSGAVDPVSGLTNNTTNAGLCARPVRHLRTRTTTFQRRAA